jgi:hypothetical protein
VNFTNDLAWRELGAVYAEPDARGSPVFGSTSSSVSAHGFFF